MTFEPGQPVLFMKVGTHAGETLEDILVRKQREIDEAGFAMWGYGGNTCHPTSMVQPFARQLGAEGISLCMQEMNSRHFAEQVRAAEYSTNGLDWTEIDPAINVLGSRYALCIDSLEPVNETLDLSATHVAVGRSHGRIGRDYVQGRVDKACLVIDPNGQVDPKPITINLRASVIAPHAVFLRN
jgi:hypothetical protein